MKKGNWEYRLDARLMIVLVSLKIVEKNCLFEECFHKGVKSLVNNQFKRFIFLTFLFTFFLVLLWCTLYIFFSFFLTDVTLFWLCLNIFINLTNILQEFMTMHFLVLFFNFYKNLFLLFLKRPFKFLQYFPFLFMFLVKFLFKKINSGIDLSLVVVQTHFSFLQFLIQFENIFFLVLERFLNSD